MIGFLSGTVISHTEKYILVQTGGVGYKVFVANDILGNIVDGTPIDLWIHTAVREDALELFGFQTETLLELFELLITVSGIGPKSALGILSIADTATLIHAIKTDNVSYLTQVSGIGKKTAEKIVLELKDKVEKLSLTNSVPENETLRDVVDALLAMGYYERAIRETLRSVDTTGSDSSKIIREALVILSQ